MTDCTNRIPHYLYLIKRVIGFCGDAVAYPTVLSSGVPAINGEYLGLNAYALAAGVVFSLAIAIAEKRVEDRMFAGITTQPDPRNNTLLNTLTALGYYVAEMGEPLMICVGLITLAHRPNNSTKEINLTEAIPSAISLVACFLVAFQSSLIAKKVLGMTELFGCFFKPVEREAVVPAEEQPILPAQGHTIVNIPGTSDADYLAIQVPSQTPTTHA